jgi:hypothetical protein
MVEGAALCPPSAASTASDSSPATPAADGGIRIRTSCTRQQRRRAPSRHHLLLLLSLLLPLLLSFVSGQTLLQSDNQVMFWPDTIFVPVGGQIQFKIRWFHIPNGGDLQFIKAPAAVVDCQPDTFPGTVTIDQPFDQTCTLDPGMDTTPFIMTLNYPGSHQEIAVNFEDSGTKAWVSSPAWGGGFGTGGALPGYRDGVGSEALFNHVGQGALHSNGYLMYLPDVGNHAIRTLNLNTNEVRTIWGQCTASMLPSSVVRRTLF